MALSADLLTALRLGLAIVLTVLVARGDLEAAAVGLSAAWLTDALDGALARAAGGGTRLGEWDLPADVLVGAGVLTGLGLAGDVPAPVALAVTPALLIAFVVIRNPFPGMVLQAIAYGGILWRLWAEGAATRWVPVAVAGVIGIAERRRFVRVMLPTFFRGAASTARLRRGHDYRVPNG